MITLDHVTKSYKEGTYALNDVNIEIEDGRGIVSIEKTSTEGLTDTYTITYTDETTSTFTVRNGANGQDGTNGQDGKDGADGKDGKDGADGKDGRGIVSILKTGTSGLVDTYTITYTDNTTSTFTVTNGSGGSGTSDYTDLTNKPSINSVELSGNKTSANLGLQDTLVSGTNIKTVNESSLLGNGDITIPALTGTAVYLLMEVLKNSVYKNDQTGNLSALENELYDILPTVYYSVTNTLTNVTNDNPATQAEMGDSYTATLSLPDQSYALSSITITMGGLDVTNDVYDRENMEITIPNVIGDIVITAVAGNLSLDSLAYGDLTYRDIFITGNQLQAYDFENGKPSSAVVNAGSPVISDEAYCSPGHSAKFFGTSSCQYNDAKTTTIAAGHTGFGAFKLKCDRYVKGYIGVSLSNLMPVDLTGTTNGWETKYKYKTVTNQNTQQLGFWGTYTQANADCYIDDMVFIDIDTVFGEVVPEATMVKLYNEYVAIRESEV